MLTANEDRARDFDALLEESTTRFGGALRRKVTLEILKLKSLDQVCSESQFEFHKPLIFI